MNYECVYPSLNTNAICRSLYIDEEELLLVEGAASAS